MKKKMIIAAAFTLTGLLLHPATLSAQEDDSGDSSSYEESMPAYDDSTGSYDDMPADEESSGSETEGEPYSDQNDQETPADN